MGKLGNIFLRALWPCLAALAATAVTQASAQVCQSEPWPGGGVLAGVGGGGFATAQLASILGGSIWIDWTQGTPLQSWPLCLWKVGSNQQSLRRHPSSHARILHKSGPNIHVVVYVVIPKRAISGRHGRTEW